MRSRIYSRPWNRLGSPPDCAVGGPFTPLLCLVSQYLTGGSFLLLVSSEHPQHIGQDDANRRQATGLGKEDSKAPQDQDGQLWLAEMGSIR